MSGRTPFTTQLFGRPGLPLNARAQSLFDEHRQAIHSLTDRLFALLLGVEFVIAIALAGGLARFFAGAGVPTSHDRALAIGIGSLLTFPPVGLALTRPGRTLTRHAIAVAQLGYSALFIELTRGHFPTQFHLFGSLALLAFYRDWKVFLSATAVVVADQVVRPLFGGGLPAGVPGGIPWAGLELTFAVLVVDAFLVSGCPRAVREMQDIARQRARLEETNQLIAAEVELQTAALAGSEAQYRLLFEGHPLAMWLYDAKTQAIMTVNEAAVAGYGYSREELTRMNMAQIAGTADSARHDGHAAIPATRHRRKDGTLIDVEVIEHELVFRDRPMRLMAAQDVTRRRRAEQLISIQQSVARELAVAGTLQDAARPILNLVMRSLDWDFGVLWLVNAAGTHLEPMEILAAGPGLETLEEALRGCRRARGEGLAGTTWQEGRPLGINDLADPRLSAELAALAEQTGLKTLLSVPVLGAERVVGVLQFVSRDNRMDDLPLVRALEAVGRNLGQYIERKRVESRMHLLADIVEASSDAIYAIDLEARIISWNLGARKLYGFTAAEMLGHPVTRLAPPGRVEEMMNLMDRVADGEHLVNCEVRRMRKDGALLQVHLSAGPIRDTAGHVVGLSLVARDITEEKRLQARLHQAQKLEAIGELAAGVAHEINTPTQYVGDNVQFLGRAFTEIDGCLRGWEELLTGPAAERLEPALRRQLEEVRANADLEFIRAEVGPAIAAAQDGVSRIGQIVGAMKEFSHPGTKEKAPADLNRAVQSTLTVARGEWKHHADVVTDLDPDLPMVTCRADEINQVLLNLIVNAAHAIRDARPGRGPGKGTITVATRGVGARVEIRVSDTGCGIPEEIRNRVFDPFFTTKGVGKGTGQGLAIAHDVVVVKHGGTIEFESGPGSGTTFVVSLPLGNMDFSLEAAA